MIMDDIFNSDTAAQRSHNKAEPSPKTEESCWRWEEVETVTMGEEIGEHQPCKAEGDIRLSFQRLTLLQCSSLR